MAAGADAASQFDTYFRTIIDNDPEIQAIIRGVWGTAPRPSDTPKRLEQANHQASQAIAQVLKRKGISLPDRTFINPRSGTIEGHRGWSGLSGAQKAIIIAAAAAATGGAALYAGGAFAGGGAAAGAGASASGAAPGITAGLGGLGAIGTSVPVGGTIAGLTSAGTISAGAAGAANAGALASVSPGVTTGLGATVPGTVVPIGAAGAGAGGMDPFTLSALIGGGSQLLGGLLGGIGQGKSDEATRRLQKEMQDKQLALQRDQTGLQSTQMDPLAQQKSRQQQALLAAILPEMRNASVTSNIPGMNQFIPNIQGGLRIPEGGFSADTLKFFGEPARASAEAGFFSNASPFAPPSALSSLGYTPAGVQQAAASGGQPNLTNGQSPIVPYGQQTPITRARQTSDVAGRAQSRDARNAAMLSALR